MQSNKHYMDTMSWAELQGLTEMDSSEFVVECEVKQKKEGVE